MADPGTLSVICWGPLLLIGLAFTAFGILYAVGYPILFLWAVIFSGRMLDKRIARLVEREGASLAHFGGRDPLSTLRGSHIVGGIQETGLVYSSVVFGPSHWHQLIAALANLVGGRIDIFHKVVSTARAEAKQRLRERCQADGWDEVVNVRIDTAEMTPASQPKGIRAVEVFAYGTGIRYN
ncbi:MAG: heavy metal-binding domain-containing protein [Candidatus Thalassarchaeaceae archaeon]|jgi:uncharacterized protein YbjQ (UPF0145 family)|nr:heavy metal-binding domain-containing protein [Candidatus Thalassarchaeaceae archaeon]